MSAIRLGATALWTELLIAMREDGIIAKCIEQSGPATTAVIVQAVQAVLEGRRSSTWMPMHILPQSRKQVVGVTKFNILHILVYMADEKAWYYSSSGASADPALFVGYKFMSLPEPSHEG
jgi:hypothetical protein